MLDERWMKSSRSNAGGECVEVRSPDGRQVHVRDSKYREAGALAFGSDAWRSFLDDLKTGRL
ncbi:DUF397 domain-containing protein [Halostreptopolyspora alba]|uniref:DUF397 domain-containing protein n=1 Tax=Halostreptopolyspora alba TaxID=2487137 RepID=A0A3N0EHI7_9ACTN|nr:DUF397 domain-containing protein [Nocardiopsaceae bacterium YIM 96095]